MESPDHNHEVCETGTIDRRKRPKRSLLRRILIGIGMLLLFATISFVLFFSADFRRHPPPSKYDLTHGASESEPGYGFDLSTGYGTAVVRHRNGSITHTGKVAASPAYVEMMKRLSKKGSSITGTRDYPCSPYTWAAFGDFYRWPVFWRSLRKRIGLPATTDVALLADLLKSLHQQQAEENQGFAAKSAVITFPNHQSLCQEDITDALEYLDIYPLSSRQLYGQPHELSAAYAGYGMGLCHNTTDLSACRAEEHNMYRNMTLAISFTRDALTVETYPFKDAYQYMLPNSYTEHPVDYDLGLDALTDFPDPVSYWARVHDTICAQISREGRLRNPIDTIVLYGEAASSTKFQSVVREVVESLQDIVPIFSAESEFVAARGAAELAHRAQMDRAQQRKSRESAKEGPLNEEL